MASELETLMAIERSGDLNPAQRTRLAELKQSGSYGNSAGIIGGPIDSGGGIPTPYTFDYAAEAQKAYGELGTYYTRLLTESQGDMNKLLARMVEDYDRGVRVRREDYQQAKQDYDTALANTNRTAYNSAKERGLTQKSAYGAGGMGLADALIARARQPVDRAMQSNDLAYNRANEGALTERTRTEADTIENQKRREFELEQQRRTQAGSLANERGSRAYTQWSATNLV